MGVYLGRKLTGIAFFDELDQSPGGFHFRMVLPCLPDTIEVSFSLFEILLQRIQISQLVAGFQIVGIERPGP